MMEEESRRNHTGGVMKKESRGRNHGSGIKGGRIREESWRMHDGGGFMEEVS